jgi:hypothetical protein
VEGNFAFYTRGIESTPDVGNDMLEEKQEPSKGLPSCTDDKAICRSMVIG